MSPPPKSNVCPWLSSVPDPHIKIAGHKDNVASARAKVMMVLDTKVSAVLSVSTGYCDNMLFFQIH